MTFLLLPPTKVIEVIKEALGPHSLKVTLPINPVPASRPRVSKWGTYYGKNYTKWRKECERIVKTFTNTIGLPCTVLVEHVVRKPRTSKLTYPRGDVDNYAKATLDGLTKKDYWTDDDIITGLYTSKRFAEPEEEPHTEVTVYVHKE